MKTEHPEISSSEKSLWEKPRLTTLSLFKTLNGSNNETDGMDIGS